MDSALIHLKWRGGHRPMWLTLTILLLLVSHSQRVSAQNEPFHFVAMGDLAYDAPDDFAAYKTLIDTINARNPSFSVHVGDLGGTAICWNEIRDEIASLWDAFDHPLIYTPGDNEWLDCRRQFEPLERLSDLRQRFFETPRSLGKHPLPLDRQSDSDSDVFQDIVENVRFVYRHVMFTTVHVAGSHNGTTSSSPEVVLDALHRTDAALAWIESSFKVARQKSSKALVIMLHADMFHQSTGRPMPPYQRITRAIQTASESFEKPVLLVHGDAHRFIVDRVLIRHDNPLAPPQYRNITRLQVFGYPAMRAVQIGVDTSTPWVFSFSPLYAVGQ